MCGRAGVVDPILSDESSSASPDGRARSCVQLEQHSTVRCTVRYCASTVHIILYCTRALTISLRCVSEAHALRAHFWHLTSLLGIRCALQLVQIPVNK